MPPINLKLVIYLTIVLIASILWLTYELTKRRSRHNHNFQSSWAASPFGAILLTPDKQLQFANTQACRLLHIEDCTQIEEAETYQTLLGRVQPNTSTQHFILNPVPDTALDVWSALVSDNRLILLYDISTRRRREKEQQLFWGTVSHELRTPLTSILSHLEVTRTSNINPDIQQHSLEIVHQQVHRLNNLIQNTLELGRIRSATTLDLTAVDLILVAEEAIADLILIAEAMGIYLELIVAPNLPHVLANPDRLKQLFINLIDNGIKYTESGDTVTVTLKHENAHFIRCSVIDTGTGIEAEHLSRLTEQYFRVRRDKVGSGLGLAIVKEIVNLHNGELTIASQTEGVQTGTHISFTLPITEMP